MSPERHAIKALKKAKRPSRDLDVAVAMAFGAEAGFVGEIGYRMRRAPWVSYQMDRWVTLPSFTSSMDAAVRLVPDGWMWALHGGCGSCRGAQLDRPDVETPDGEAYCDDAANPAIAMCIAAITARLKSLKTAEREAGR